MSTKKCKEWFVEMPWGRVAAVAWGDPANPPVLMVHGLMDTAATFIPLVEGLPDDNYYVAFDFPGMGKSDPFPLGLIVSHLHLVESIVGIVRHMKWDNFTCFSHSLGCIITVYYNVLYPGKITKMVNADPGPAIGMLYYSACDEHAWLLYFLEDLCNNYKSNMSGSSKLYTLDKAVHAVMKSRKLSRNQAEVALSRMLVPAENGLYKLSFDPRMKMMCSDFFSEETLISFIKTNAQPTLNFNCTIRKPVHDQCDFFVARVMKNAYKSMPNVTEVNINGAHDAHITHSKELVPHLVDFLNRTVSNRTVQAKL